MEVELVEKLLPAKVLIYVVKFLPAKEKFAVTFNGQAAGAISTGGKERISNGNWTWTWKWTGHGRGCFSVPPSNFFLALCV